MTPAMLHQMSRRSCCADDLGSQLEDGVAVGDVDLAGRGATARPQRSRRPWLRRRRPLRSAQMTVAPAGASSCGGGGADAAARAGDDGDLPVQRERVGKTRRRDSSNGLLRREHDGPSDRVGRVPWTAAVTSSAAARSSLPWRWTSSPRSGLEKPTSVSARLTRPPASKIGAAR